MLYAGKKVKILVGYRNQSVIKEYCNKLKKNIKRNGLQEDTV